MRITTRCPFDCDSTYSHNTVGTKRSLGHRLDSRFCFLLKIIHHSLFPKEIIIPLSSNDSRESMSSVMEAIKTNLRLARIYSHSSTGHVLDSGNDAALTLVKQEDSGGKRYEVSHLCHANRDDICLEVQHFKLEPKATNDRCIKHQNGSDFCKGRANRSGHSHKATDEKFRPWNPGRTHDFRS